MFDKRRVQFKEHAFFVQKKCSTLKNSCEIICLRKTFNFVNKKSCRYVYSIYLIIKFACQFN